jgi:ATP-dependent helicase/nuclease subunit A
MAKGKKKSPSNKQVRASSTKPPADVATDIVPPDREEREAILTRLDTTMLVEASAGSGKTRSMVDRMIALLREGKSRTETLAAITFTRKAAAELRSRFQVSLEKAAHEASGAAKERLISALDQVERVYIGTIHSFCGRLLRERPVEAGIDPSFQELDEAMDTRLRAEAWNQYVTELIATGSPVLDELDELGLRIVDLESAFHTYANYPDVDRWPSDEVALPDLGTASVEVRRYVEHMQGLIQTLPDNPGNDTLIPKYRRIARMARQIDLDRPAELMEILAEFGGARIVQRNWPGKREQALAELDRWDDFTATTAQPLVELWLQKRYPCVVRVLANAMRVYDRLRADAGGLNYQDLLLQAAALLRDKPQIRRYFRRRFTHLLVDEFQDTDPVQAAVMLLLTGDDATETDWRRCRPVPGALFVVGDPKQSIYRFRRADIVTYNEVKKIIRENGEIVVLRANFRSLKPVIDWVNQTFNQVLPAEADVYSPQRSPMETVHGSDSKGVPGSVQILRIPSDFGTNDEAVEFESEVIARTIQAAVGGIDGSRIASPGEFLIIGALKRNLSVYARKLSERGIPCDVTGGAVLNEVGELGLLCVCLEAVIQPDNPVALVAALRSELFGIRDDALYEFKRSDGRFSFHATIPDDVGAEVTEPLERAFGRLRRYDLWLKRLPPVAAIERIAADLGLEALAAVGPGGNVRAGSIGRAIEIVRAAQSTLYSITEVVGCLRQLVDGEERHDGLPAATPQLAPVRIMNLHQAKGLEAPFVFLADPTGRADHEPNLSIDRSGDRVCGFMQVSVKRGQHQREVLARPAGWDVLAVEEERFQDAEKNRLLYVAGTRGGTQLIISQREKGNRWNPWSPFADYLSDCPDIPIPECIESSSTPERIISPDEPATAVGRIVERWGRSQEPSYALAAAKAISVTPSPAMPSAGEHGTEWGTVIHALLEAAMRKEDADLMVLAHSGLQEQGLDPSLAAKAVEIVRAVMESEIWKRAVASPCRLVEVPFQTLLPTTGDVDDVPTILRGVIDLVFHEEAGWVVVDYKTDRRSGTDVLQLVEHYRGQLETYASVWEEITGESVAEKGLYFTHPASYIQV